MKRITFLATLLVAAQMSVTAQTHNGHEYVDLGLTSNLLWAKCNVGATAPEEVGDYFAWAETAPKAGYYFKNEGDYKYGVYDYTAEDYGITKYNSKDGKVTLEATDDAAVANWGSDWRTPTLDEYNELLTECTWTVTYCNNVRGYEVKGKNGNSIFLPMTGYIREAVLQTTANGYYWTSSLVQSEVRSASCLNLDVVDGASMSGCIRFFGVPVRAVVEKDKVTSALENVEFAQNIYTHNGGIYGAEDLQIFNLVGQNVTNQNGTLNNGIYIVKVGNRTQKIFVGK